MKYVRMAMEVESPEELGYGNLRQNLAESSMTDLILGELDLDLKSLVLMYGDHRGHPGVREILAKEAGLASGQQVLLCAGAAMALFVVATSLLEREDHLVVVRPNYATNLETPRAIGCGIHFQDLTFEEGWAVDPAAMEAAIRPETKLLSVTTPHNPTGQVMKLETLKALIAIVEKRGLWLLVDETYRDMSFDAPLPVAASLSPRVISVSSLSKTYGMPGIRLGWILCQDEALMTTFLAAKEQIVITGSMVDEAVALSALERKATWLPQILANIKNRFETVDAWMNGQDVFEWVSPKGGVVGFVRIKDSAKADPDKFYQSLNDDFGTWVGPGHWFEQPRRYFRLGYGWPSVEELKVGLDSLSGAAANAKV